MKVSDLRKYLSDKKSDAKIEVIAHNKAYKFSMSLGGGCDGGEGDNYDSVLFYVGELCESETGETEKIGGIIEKS